MELIINPEFRDKIPPLTDDEFRQLEENILNDGEVFEPIAVWNKTIVDGHNRWKIIQKHPEIPYRLKEMTFADKWEAFEWMYKKQLGRRNLTEQQREYMIGKMYEARKKSHVNCTERGDDGKYRGRQNGANGGKTSIQIAKELGIGQKTVERSEKFAKGVDALREVDPKVANDVLAGKSNTNKQDIRSLADANKDDVKRTAEAIAGSDKPLPIKKPVSRDKEKRESLNEINEIWATMTDTERVIEHTADDLIEDIKVNGKTYISLLRRTIDMKKDWIKTDTDRANVRMAIDNIMNKIREVRLAI